MRELQAEKGGLLGPMLVQLGYVSETDLAETLCKTGGWLHARKTDYESPLVGDGVVSTEFLLQNLVLPLRDAGDHIEVAVTDPGDGFIANALALAFDRPVQLQVGLLSDIQAALARHAADPESTELEHEAVGAAAGSEADEIAHLRDMASDAPVVRRVNELLTRALESRASDIHIEPDEREVVIRYRIDGVLRNVDFPRSIPPAAIVSRIKVMANLNIAERRLPQDGRIKLRSDGRAVDLRVSTVPTLYGESVVMRLLDRGDVDLDFWALGFEEQLLERFERLLARPHGIILVTGPTGSGKTTTLYAALSALNSPDNKILTVEDLRQDPDVIMVGEMRDLETARIAVQAALTGHKVFSTLHTNDAVSSITRLLDMQVDDYLLTSTIDGVLAQRLVRRLCPDCRTPYAAPELLVDKLGLDRLDPTGELQLYRAHGCAACDHTGYRGRTTILELLEMTEPMRRAVIAHADADTLREVAHQGGMEDMHTDGLRKALAGVTTLDEVERVVQAEALRD